MWRGAATAPREKPTAQKARGEMMAALGGTRRERSIRLEPCNRRPPARRPRQDHAARCGRVHLARSTQQEREGGSKKMTSCQMLPKRVDAAVTREILKTAQAARMLEQARAAGRHVIDGCRAQRRSSAPREREPSIVKRSFLERR